MNFISKKNNEVRRARPLLGTFVEISAGGLKNEKLHQAINQAFESVELVHQLMSFHDPKSDLSKLNLSAFKRPVKLHRFTYQVLKTCQKISRATGGLFDCTVAPSLMQWGYLPKVSGSSCFQGNFKDIELLPSEKVAFKRPLCIDLGGIAKGYAVDLAVATLEHEGVSFGCVNAGGDLKFFGKKQPLYIRSPKHPGSFIFFGQAQNLAVATSSSYFSGKSFGREKVSPLINPLTRKPCVEDSSVSVFASSCMIADALTKAVVACGDRNPDFLKRFRAKAVILEARGITPAPKT